MRWDGLSGAGQGLQWLLFLQYELLLFSAVWLALGALDEIAMDIAWVSLRLRGGGKAQRCSADLQSAPLSGPMAIFVPAWQEATVIGATVAHTLGAWSQPDYTLYVGCYRNDPATPAAALSATTDPRLRVVIVDADGPTTKGDCLNRLYAALCEDEAIRGVPYRGIVLQDAEDMVHPAGLAAIDEALKTADFVQLPVHPELQRHSHWIAGHYADEFREAHAKELVVRDALGAAIPAAGVGCGFARGIIAALAERRSAIGGNGPSPRIV
jgi:adsorption protein B